MARPTMLTRDRHERIVELLRDGVPFATACRRVGVSPSAGYEWLYRGWGMHPDRPPKPRYVAFARAVDAVFPGGFAERHEDEFAENEFSEFSESVEGFADAQSNEGTATAEPQNRWKTGEAVGGFCEFRESGDGFAEGFSEFPQSGKGFAESAEPAKSDTQRDRARARRGRRRGSPTRTNAVAEPAEPGKVDPRYGVLSVARGWRARADVQAFRAPHGFA